MADGSEITSLAAAHGIRSGGNGWINAGLPLGINSMVIQSKRSPCSTTVSTEIGSLSWCSNVMPPNSGGNVSTGSITVGLGSGQLGDSASSTPDSINFAGLPVDNTIWSEDVLPSGRFYGSIQNLERNLHEGLYRRALKQEKVEEVLRRPSWELMGNFTSFQEQEDKSVCESSDLRYDPHDLADDRRVGCCNRKLSDLAGSWSLAAADLSVNTLADIQMPYEGLAEGNGSQGFEPQIYKGEDFPYGLDVSFAKSVTAGNNHSQSGGAIIAAEADDPGVLWAPCSSTSNIILPGGLSPAAVPPPPSKLQSTVLSIPLGEKHLCDLSSSTSYRAAVPQPYNSHPNGSSSPRYNNTPQKPEGNQLNNITQRLNLPFDVDKARDSRTHDAPMKSITTESSTTSSFKRPRLQTSPAPLPTFKVRKEKLGDRITTLQQLVSPFGKTDTASVLLEAVGYIKFLHEQVRILSTPYMNSGGNSAQAARHQLVPWGSSDNNDSDESKPDLRSRGLCLVPLSSTFDVGDDTNATDCWTLPFIECNYR